MKPTDRRSFESNSPDVSRLCLLFSLDESSQTEEGKKNDQETYHDLPSNILQVSITILDINDNPPVFEMPEYNYMVTIRAPIGTQFGSIKVITVISANLAAFKVSFVHI